MTVFRWKVMAGVLGVSIGGLAAIAGQAGKTDDGKTTPPAPAAAPGKVPPPPPVELPGLDPLPAAPAGALKLPDVPAPAPVPVGAPKVGGLDVPAVAAPALPAPTPEPVRKPEPVRLEVKPEAAKPDLTIPGAAPLPTPGFTPPVLPAETPTSLPKPTGPLNGASQPPAFPAPTTTEFKPAPAPMAAPPALGTPSAVPSSPGGVVPAGPGVPMTPTAPVGGTAPQFAPPSPPVGSVPGNPGLGAPELSPSPPVTTPATAAQTKFRILLQVGQGEPTFEVRHGDDLVMKVLCEKVDVKSPESGQGLSAVTATGRVRFVGFGAEGTCQQLSFLAGTGEVLMNGKVMIQVKDKLGRVESELSTESIKYKVDAAAMPGALKP